jgi:hypothetical protein
MCEIHDAPTSVLCFPVFGFQMMGIGWQVWFKRGQITCSFFQILNWFPAAIAGSPPQKKLIP